MVCVHVVDLNCVLWRAVSDGEDEDPEVQPRPSRRRLLHHRHAQILQQGIRRFPLEAIRATSCCRRSAVPPPVLPVPDSSSVYASHPFSLPLHHPVGSHRPRSLIVSRPLL